MPVKDLAVSQRHQRGSPAGWAPTLQVNAEWLLRRYDTVIVMLAATFTHQSVGCQRVMLGNGDLLDTASVINALAAQHAGIPLMPCWASVIWWRAMSRQQYKYGQASLRQQWSGLLVCH